MSEGREKVLLRWKWDGVGGPADCFLEGWDARDAHVAELTAALRDPETGMPYEFGQLVARKSVRIAELEAALRGMLDDAHEDCGPRIRCGKCEGCSARAALSGQAPENP